MIIALPGAALGRNGEYERLIRLIVDGVAAARAGCAAVHGPIEAVRSPAVVAVTLAVGAAGLLIAERFGAKHRGEETMTPVEAFAIGIAQASALVPGVSRSGATMTVAMLFGLRRDGAARFVFLLSLPAVAAAAAKEMLELSEIGMAAVPVTLLAIGFVSSAIVGYLTIRFFLRYLANHSLAVFAYYRFARGGPHPVVAGVAGGRVDEPPGHVVVAPQLHRRVSSSSCRCSSASRRSSGFFSWSIR